uniref:SFRICE_005660 n=1 Tax=Spodoptera frugiperda TaxID=7108 RepID=A0A2H1WB32_SPOFR
MGAQLIQFTNGKTLLMYQKYTFSMQGVHKNYGICSRKRGRKCKARLRLNKCGEIVFAETNHSHPPPKLMKNANGQYVRIDNGEFSYLPI